MLDLWSEYLWKISKLPAFSFFCWISSWFCLIQNDAVLCLIISITIISNILLITFGHFPVSLALIFSSNAKGLFHKRFSQWPNSKRVFLFFNCPKFQKLMLFLSFVKRGANSFTVVIKPQLSFWIKGRKHVKSEFSTWQTYLCFFVMEIELDSFILTPPYFSSHFPTTILHVLSIIFIMIHKWTLLSSSRFYKVMALPGNFYWTFGPKPWVLEFFRTSLWLIRVETHIVLLCSSPPAPSLFNDTVHGRWMWSETDFQPLYATSLIC